ncbi:MAG: CcmD family protein [Thermodesulfobacteriota bacterium]
MDNTGYLMAANVAVWLGIGGYLLFLAGRQKQLELRLKRMEVLDGSRD